MENGKILKRLDSTRSQGKAIINTRRENTVNTNYTICKPVVSVTIIKRTNCNMSHQIIYYIFDN